MPRRTPRASAFTLSRFRSSRSSSQKLCSAPSPPGLRPWRPQVIPALQAALPPMQGRWRRPPPSASRAGPCCSFTLSTLSASGKKWAWRRLRRTVRCLAAASCLARSTLASLCVRTQATSVQCITLSASLFTSCSLPCLASSISMWTLWCEGMSASSTTHPSSQRAARPGPSQQCDATTSLCASTWMCCSLRYPNGCQARLPPSTLAYWSSILCVGVSAQPHASSQSGSQ
mmetsp:Transcript_35256/g.76794  ORF Transcript_35256/g.76794 Transcript_35256/m.76794 type:complete len:230 (-) Transcript_35256:230-919(-)